MIRRSEEPEAYFAETAPAAAETVDTGEMTIAWSSPNPNRNASPRPSPIRHHPPKKPPRPRLPSPTSPTTSSMPEGTVALVPGVPDVGLCPLGESHEREVCVRTGISDTTLCGGKITIT